MSGPCIVHTRLPKDHLLTGWGRGHLCRFHGDAVVEHLVCYYCLDRHKMVDQRGPSNERGERQFIICPESDEFQTALALMAKDGA